MLNNKKGQIGESITWMVATIILIVVLLIFIYASIVLAKVKSLKLSMEEESEISFDWINSKTQIAYSIDDRNKEKISNWISKERGNG